MADLTQHRLKELLHYSSDTGVFTRKVRSSPSVKVGDVAGCKDRTTGYVRIRVDSVKWAAHRLAFLYMLGYIPPQVDHDNHIRHDNKWNNLNAALPAINSHNQKLRITNTSGVMGVGWDRSRNRWRTRIMVDGKRIHLGDFNTIELATSARKSAEIRFGFNKNHGAKPGPLGSPRIG